ncbi:aspartate-semialdehyde dehydrogenase [Candidatus Fermentibacteria bacterium]|nr:aspartate-semialdehyde dehydrogenase [Candidatus Fermentibacteria bacterium]
MIAGVVGATGLVGREMAATLGRLLPGRIDRFLPFASDGSAGRTVEFEGRRVAVLPFDPGSIPEGAWMLGATSAAVASEWVPEALRRGAVVIDNSSRYRMDPGVPLVVPEVNPHAIPAGCRLVANPNCSTIQLVAVLAPLLDLAGVEWVAVSTYQSVSGAGGPALDELEAQQKGRSPLPREGWFHENILTSIGQDGGGVWCEEETKLMNETAKILGRGFPVFAACARVPVRVGHVESVTVRFESCVDAGAAARRLESAPGVAVSAAGAPPVSVAGTDEVVAGRLRNHPSDGRILQLWITADNVRKGAALNAVQILRLMAGDAVR